ncbi:tRNA-dihydrouridine(47) synthase [NAD(P)(+)]-like [Glandiceps talaboti]
MDNVLEVEMAKEGDERDTDSCRPASAPTGDECVQQLDQTQERPSSEEELDLSNVHDGNAKVKPEFIDWSKAKEKLGKKDDNIQEDPDQKQSGENLDTEKSQDKTETEVTEEPATKKSKKDRKDKRGQNKRRPRDKFIDAADRVCPAILNERECLFGDKCKFSHKIENFLAKKPKDISDKCYTFDKYGRCQYGITCRFGSSHISDNNTNVVNDDKYKNFEPNIKNTLAKDLQRLLWKRKYKFEKADRVLKMLTKINRGGSQGKGQGSTDKGMQKETDVGNGMAANKNVADAVASENTSSVQNLNLLQTEENGGPPSIAPVNLATETSSADSCKTMPELNSELHHLGTVTDADLIKLRSCEKKKIDFSDKLYLAPLTTVGNLPYRRICKNLGADITCGEMAMCTNILQGQLSEWALLKRHSSEDIFGVQLCGSFPDTMTKCADLLSNNIDIDFIDVNVGCPIDLVFKKGGGCALMGRLSKFEQIVTGMTSVMDVPLTVKMRTGIQDKSFTAHKVIPKLKDWGVSMVTLHGRSREQRYTKLADWDYINECAKAASPMPLFGNGDILSYEDANRQREHTGVTGVMIARGALIKPWVFTEIKEQRHWDISSTERFDILQDFANFGLEHWGSDQQGVDRTRRFLLEWLSFLYRYIPVGVLERVPQRINERPPQYFGRNDLETLMASSYCNDWIKISEMLLGPVPDDFQFLPKHRANSYR